MFTVIVMNSPAVALLRLLRQHHELEDDELREGFEQIPTKIILEIIGNDKFDDSEQEISTDDWKLVNDF